MKFKDDEWLTNYVNALHFTGRWIETQNKDRDIADVWKTETSALIQETLLCNIPMEVHDIQRITRKLSPVETDVGNNAGPTQMKTYEGDTLGLISDYVFICEGLEEFTLEDVMEECSAYFSKIYPDVADMRATITELFNKDLEMGGLEEIMPGLYRHKK